MNPEDTLQDYIGTSEPTWGSVYARCFRVLASVTGPSEYLPSQEYELGLAAPCVQKL